MPTRSLTLSCATSSSRRPDAIDRRSSALTGWRIRDYQAGDVDGILRLWEQVLTADAEPVYGLSDVLASSVKTTPWLLLWEMRWSALP